MAQDISKTVNEKISKLPDCFVAIVTAPTVGYNDINLAVMKHLVSGKGMPGIYVTVNKPYETLASLFKKNNIDTKKLFFIDAISGSIGAKSGGVNCKIIQNPSALTDLGIQITQAINSKNPKFLILDSLSTMLVYNNVPATIRFVHFLITNLRKNNVAGIIFSMEKDLEKKTLDNIAMFVDKVIKFS